ncbi:MAG: glycoside hydrolase 43 family protein [Myxococcota bacterium]
MREPMWLKPSRIVFVLSAACAAYAAASMNRAFERRAQFSADLGDGTYRNPVLFGDFSDPDAIYFAGHYLLVASTFGRAPGLTLLRSTDLVNWEFLPQPLQKLVPEERFRSPRHADGVWAPSIREHAGELFIFYPDPDTGIYVISARDPEGPWSAPRLLLAGRGLIDPCPFWDDDGRAYLIHAWAKSRAGFNNRLTLHEMASDTSRLLDEGATLIDGDTLSGYRTLEGPKFYKRDGWYYVFAPAGGVRDGFQAVFRARHVRGPYEPRIVLAQGKTRVNGPHQGAWVETRSGQSWFLHFQELSAFGRVVHLQPMRFENGFPVIGNDREGDGVGEPVARHAKPSGTLPPSNSGLAPSDEFDGARLAESWQWSSNFSSSWYSLRARPGFLRLYAQRLPSDGTLWSSAAVLSQRLQGPRAEFRTRLDARTLDVGTRAGLVVLGDNYRWIGIERDAQGFALGLVEYQRANLNARERWLERRRIEDPELDLAAEVDPNGLVRFAYGAAGKRQTRIGDAFAARPLGRWVGARIGIFCTRPTRATRESSADFAWFRVRRP